MAGEARGPPASLRRPARARPAARSAFDATAGVVHDWMYDKLAQEYVLDEQPGISQPVGMTGSRLTGVYVQAAATTTTAPTSA